MNWTSAAFVVCAMGVAAPDLRASDVSVSVVSVAPNTSDISLDTRVNAAPAALWKLLTDYDHHAGLLPYLTKSRIVERRTSAIVVEQEGKIQILFWSFTMSVRQQVVEEPIHHMHFEAVEGDFERLEGDWNVSPAGPDTSLRCRFTVKPRRKVPDWAVRLAARYYLKKMVHALADKAEAPRP